MAHPSKNLPKNLYYINSQDELTAPEGRHFFSITSLDGGAVNVKGVVYTSLWMLVSWTTMTLPLDT